MTGPGKAPLLKGRSDALISQRGVTLLELVVSLAVSSILGVGLVSATMLAARALPERKPAQTAFTQTHAWLRALQSDLDLSIAQLPGTDQRLVLLTGDQTGDQQPDRVVYERIDGQLTRTLNDENSQPYGLADALAFTPAVQTDTVSYPGPMVWQPASIVSRYEVPETGQDQTIEFDHWYGQVIAPSLPPEALAWRITGLGIVARPVAQLASSFTLKLYETDGNALPTGPALARIPTNPWLWGSGETYDPNGFDDTNEPTPGSSNGDHRWMVFELDPPQLRPRQDPIALTVEALTVENRSPLVNQPAQVRIQDTNAWGAIAHRGEWSLDTGRSMLHRLYGQIAVAGDRQPTTRPHLHALHVTVTPPAGPLQQHALHPFKRVPQLQRVWLATMDTDPTQTDLDLNGKADWAAASSGAFDGRRLENGVWTARTRLDTEPIDIDGEAVIQARVRTASVDDPGLRLTGTFNPNAGRTTFSQVRLTLKQPAADQQRLELAVWDGLQFEPQILSDDLGAGFIEIQLVLNAEQQAVALWVNGRYLGTCACDRHLLPAAFRGISLDASGATAQIDHLSIRVMPGGLR